MEKPSTADERRSAANVWLRYASEDLTGENEQLLPRHRCFFAQQAAEKAIKSVLAYDDLDPPKIHDLNRLLLLTGGSLDLGWDIGDLEWLAQWVVDSRYPAPADEIARDVVERVREVLTARFESTE